jgi:hypothetical protein
MLGERNPRPKSFVETPLLKSTRILHGSHLFRRSRSSSGLREVFKTKKRLSILVCEFVTIAKMIWLFKPPADLKIDLAAICVLYAHCGLSTPRAGRPDLKPREIFSKNLAISR